jgi:hypothetical protein
MTTEGSVDLQKSFEIALLLNLLTNMEPGTATSRINKTLLRSRAPAWTIAQTLRTGHRADESSFWQNTIATHLATKEPTFDGSLNGSEYPHRPGFPVDRIIGRVIAPKRVYGHNNPP